MEKKEAGKPQTDAKAPSTAAPKEPAPQPKPKEPTEAAKKKIAETKANAEAGDVIAQTNLGLMYGTGQGVGENNVTAYAWWDIAATNGDQNAKNNKSIVAKKMTPAQITKAGEFVKEMVKNNPKLINK